MRSIQERERVAELVEAGLNDCQIARETGIPRATVREWRAQSQPRGWPRRPGDVSIDDLPTAPYAYLLGVSWRRMNHKSISVARRDSVAILDQFIGPKR